MEKYFIEIVDNEKIKIRRENLSKEDLIAEIYAAVEDLLAGKVLSFVIGKSGYEERHFDLSFKESD